MPDEKRDCDLTRQELINAYQAAGNKYLAYRLTRLFCSIKDETDRCLHNEIAREIAFMVGDNAERCLLAVANTLMMNAQKEGVKNA